jgi:hypothetical protein
MWFARVDDSLGTTRGGTAAIQPVHPRDVEVSLDELTFEWSGVSAEARVRLNVADLDRPGEPLIEREVVGVRYSPSAEERRRFQPGQTIYWYVELREASAAGSSPAARFRVR